MTPDFPRWIPAEVYARIGWPGFPGAPPKRYRGAPRRAGMWFVWSSGSFAPFPDEQGGTLSSPHRGAIACGKTTHTPTGLRRTLFSELARRTVRAVRFTHRGPSTGGVTPGRFRGCWLRRSPPRPSIHGLSVCIGALEVPTTGVRDTFERVHATLLTLTPTLPSRPDPCGPTCRPDCLSWVVQRSPLHRPESKSPTPGVRVSAAPFGEEQPVLPALRPRGFAPPRRFTPLRPCRFVAPCSRSWGSPCFVPSRNGPPHGVVPALRSFPSADSGGSGHSLAGHPLAGSGDRLRGLASRARPSLDASLHRSPCPLTLHSVHREDGFPSHVRRGLPRRLPGAGASRPCSIVGSVALMSVATHESPVLPWAWPALPTDSPVRSPPLSGRGSR